jgi:hypothetical protein
LQVLWYRRNKFQYSTWLAVTIQVAGSIARDVEAQPTTGVEHPAQVSELGVPGECEKAEEGLVIGVPPSVGAHCKTKKERLSSSKRPLNTSKTQTKVILPHHPQAPTAKTMRQRRIRRRHYLLEERAGPQSRASIERASQALLPAIGLSKLNV